jgi:translation initiation factor IF-1
MKPWGDRRFPVKLVSTGKCLECRLAGKIPRGRDNRIEEGDYVLVEIRNDESDTDMHNRRGTIILKYTSKEINKLQRKGELIEMRSSQFHDLYVDFVDSEPSKSDDKPIYYEWDLPPSSSDSEDDD